MAGARAVGETRRAVGLADMAAAEPKRQERAAVPSTVALVCLVLAGTVLCGLRSG